MIALTLYLIALFFLGLGNAAIVYHILRYRDSDDASGTILFVYCVLVFVILTGTALFFHWQDFSFAF